MNNNSLMLTGEFTGKGKIERIFYNADYGRWYIGELPTSKQLNWRLICEDIKLSHLSIINTRVWTGNFTGCNSVEILLYDEANNIWFIGKYRDSHLSFEIANCNNLISDLVNLKGRTWIGNFIGNGKTEILIYYIETGNWYVGTFKGTKLSFTLISNTSKFGNLSIQNSKIWIGDFTGIGKKEILFYTSEDGKWFIGRFDGADFNWHLAADTFDFGDLNKGNVKMFTGDFSGNGSTELMFYCGDNGIWYIGRFKENELTWRIYSLSYALREDEEREFFETMMNLFDGILDLEMNILESVAKFYGFKDEAETLHNLMVFYAGFHIDRDQLIFYPRSDIWQRNTGHFSLYDENSKLAMMNIHCETILFNYDNKSWKIELWKGQYGICTGAEIGIYTGEIQDNSVLGVGDHTLNRFNLGKYTNNAKIEDMLKMSFRLRKNDVILFTRGTNNVNIKKEERYWWLAGFKPGEKSKPSELKLEAKITLKDKEMRDAFIDGLIRIGYSRENGFNINDLTVMFDFDKPHREYTY